MPGQYEEVTLDNLNSGQIVALFEREMKKVLENIADENTPAKATRAIVLSIKIKPEEDRASVIVEVDGHSKLASVKPSKSYALLSFDDKGIRAWQTDPKQMLLDMEKKPEGEGKARILDGPGAVARGR